MGKGKGVGREGREERRKGVQSSLIGKEREKGSEQERERETETERCREGKRMKKKGRSKWSLPPFKGTGYSLPCTQG